MKKGSTKVLKTVYDKMVKYRCCNVSATQGDLTKIEYKNNDIKKEADKRTGS